MRGPRTIPRWTWLVIPAFLGAGTLCWVLASTRDPGVRLASRAAFDERPFETAIPASAVGSSRMAQAIDLVRVSRTDRLVRAYADWAGDPSAIDARKLLLNALLASDSPGLALSNVLGALDADRTPPEDDPLWSYAVDKISRIWRGKTLTQGLDLMVAEQRPRARRAVVASFAAFVNSGRASELEPDQRQTLTNDFIDGFKALPSGQKPEVERALRTIAGNDAADVLLGKGLGDGYELEHERQYEKSLAEAQGTFVPAKERSGATSAPAP